jgi:HSP20 family protein
MNQLIRWNSFNGLDRIGRQMAELLEGDAAGVPNQTTEMWSPTVDIFEDDHGYLFKIDLPGVKKEEVTVQIENGVLTIAGERKTGREQKIRRVHRIERAYGGFTRGFELPEDAETGNVDASFKDGVLTVVVAKAEHAKPRKIDVKVV